MADKPSQSRRDFLVTVAAGGVATLLPRGLVAATRGATLTPRPMKPPARSKVILVKTEDRADGVRRALAALDLSAVQGKHVLIKPNLNSADPAPGSTHLDVLRATVTELRRLGAGRITVGDRSGMGDTRRVMTEMGVLALARELKLETVVFEGLPASGWVRVTPKGSHWKQGFPFPRLALDAGAVVNLCCLKTHRFGGHFTLSLKNSVGLAGKRVPGDRHDYMHELHLSRHQRQMIAEVNTAYVPAAVVIDGIDAFTDGGPDKGRRVHPGVVLTGTDRVAIDAVGVAILRQFGTTRAVSRGRIFEQDQLARAARLGLGVDGPGKIDLTGVDDASRAYAAELLPVLRA